MLHCNKNAVGPRLPTYHSNAHELLTIHNKQTLTIIRYGNALTWTL